MHLLFLSAKESPAFWRQNDVVVALLVPSTQWNRKRVSFRRKKKKERGGKEKDSKIERKNGS